MLAEIKDFIIKLFIFGIGYYALNIIIDALDSVIVYTHTLKIVVMFIWTVIPGIYLVAKAFELWQTIQEERAK